jgi:hypothetical protein
MYLDTAGHDRLDWCEVGEAIEDAYRRIAPKTLIAELDNR